MALSYNKVQLIGMVGQDPKIKEFSDGKKIASLSLATNDYWKDKATGEKKERTEWHRIAIFAPNLVKLVESHIKKGDRLFIEGSLFTKEYTDKEGVLRKSTEVSIQPYHGSIIILSPKPKSNDGNSLEPAQDDNIIDDQMPF